VGGYNLARDVAYNKANEFKQANASIAAFDSIIINGRSVRVVCKEPRRALILLQQEMIIGKEVKVTMPRGSDPTHTGRTAENQVEPTTPASECWKKGVLKKVPLDIAEQDIARDLDAVWVHRIKKWANGQQTATRVVIIAFAGELPHTRMFDFQCGYLHIASAALQ